MKKTITILSLAFTAVTANATVITVSNNPNSPGQYSDLQTAINAASPNDTLYVHGSGNNYGNVIITQPLTIIGAGGMPNKNLPLETLIQTISYTFTTNDTSSGSGSRLYGCNLIGGYYEGIVLGTNSTNVLGVSDIVIARNKINMINFYSTNALYNNYLIENNVITRIGNSTNNSISHTKLNNAIIKNNIIGHIVQLGTNGAGSWTCSNNTILWSVGINQAATFTNNIFYVEMVSGSSSQNLYSIFTNNIFYSTTDQWDPTIFNTGTNSGSGNLVNQNPDFVHYDPAATAVFSYTFNTPATGPFVDFNLQGGSIGKNYGTDGTDVGVYGGASPYVEGTPANSRYRYFPLPAIPQMLNMTIINTTVPQNGTLNVNFKARKQN